ncbi:calmodulin-binding transcription activator 2 isoform X2 [Denticeps clupeoides]|uniref:calmodulin-binding transcription activator 2 isoform X2 n=1 Tax=Denticeps clupeoides TaxID=299321 RepID=UPI0010A2DFC9|nr:calmodulin-binding transcription activator 2-like isoform X2 [Denticeps clupeoides]
MSGSSPSLSLTLSPPHSAPSLLPLSLEASLGLDSLSRPLSPTPNSQRPPPSVVLESSSPQLSGGDHLLLVQTGHMAAGKMSPDQQQPTDQLDLLSTNQMQVTPLQPKHSSCLTNQMQVEQESQRKEHLLFLQQQGLMEQPVLKEATHAPCPQPGPDLFGVGGATVQVKEEQSSPLALPAAIPAYEAEETPMDTHAHSPSHTPPDSDVEAELSFDSTFPDLISELINEGPSSEAAEGPGQEGPLVALPVFPVRYVVPPQPSPSSAFIPFPQHPATAPPGGQHRRPAAITDFSPEWSYPEGGVKVLITGPWTDMNGRYSCVFDQSSVPASLIQHGVLRCYCPAHEAGLVALHVVEDSGAVSSSALFEYRARNAASLPSSQLDWLSLDDNQFRMSILERLEQMERRMAEMSTSHLHHHNHHHHPPPPSHHQQQLWRQPLPAPDQSVEDRNQSGTSFERRIVGVCERMMAGGRWSGGGGGGERLVHSARHRGMTLLHLAAAQGYTQLIHTLIQWRCVNSDSLDLEQEVDPLNVDHFSCTPLMWACALGHQAAAVLLYQWSSVALGTPDSLGRLPLAVARSRGHTQLARAIEELHTHTHGRTHTLHPAAGTHTHNTSPLPQLPPSPLSTSPDTGLSSSSSILSHSEPPSPSPSSAYSSGSIPPASPPDAMDTLSPSSSPSPSLPLAWGEEPVARGSSPRHALFLMDYEPACPAFLPETHTRSAFEAELLSYSENAENENYLPAEVLQVDMATLAEQIIEATPDRIKQEEFPRGAESPLRERRDNQTAIHDTMPWLATYLDTVDTLPAMSPSSEQRELYEAARIIQNAFRRYKGRRLKEQQDMAAAVIQRCYRKYKQLTWIALKYALYKKMTQAAILIQSKFRSYYEQKKFQQSRRAAVLIQQYYRSYKEYERLKAGPRGSGALNPKIKGSFLTKKQDQAARKIMRFLRRCRHRIKELKQNKELERRGLTT